MHKAAQAKEQTWWQSHSPQMYLRGMSGNLPSACPLAQVCRSASFGGTALDECICWRSKDQT